MSSARYSDSAISFALAKLVPFVDFFRLRPSVIMKQSYQKGERFILIGGRRLAELMIEHNIGVAEEQAYSVRKIDSDYFSKRNRCRLLRVTRSRAVTS